MKEAKPYYPFEPTMFFSYAIPRNFGKFTDQIKRKMTTKCPIAVSLPLLKKNHLIYIDYHCEEYT